MSVGERGRGHCLRSSGEECGELCLWGRGGEALLKALGREGWVEGGERRDGEGRDADLGNYNLEVVLCGSVDYPSLYVRPRGDPIMEHCYDCVDTISN